MEKFWEELVNLFKGKLENTRFQALIPYLLVICLFIWFILRPISFKALNFGRKYLIKRKLSYTSLQPCYSVDEIINSRRFYITTKCQVSPPSYEQEPLHSTTSDSRENLVRKFISDIFKSPLKAEKYYFILADSGMGKTTFMLNLYRKYKKKYFKQYNIELFPLGWKETDEKLKNYPKDKAAETILLLDGFDEDRKAQENYKSRLFELEELTYYFKQIIITCRIQFFPTEIEEPSQLATPNFGPLKGIDDYKKLYIAPFYEREINKYLNKVFPFYQLVKKFKAKKLVNDSKYLMVRPFLLSYINDLIASDLNLKYSRSIYQTLIDKWIEREAAILPKGERAKFKQQLYLFSQELALDLYFNQDIREGLFAKESEILIVAKKNNIDLNSLELRSRSLLNRNATNYKFAHKSIFEFFIAKYAFENVEFRNKLNFRGFEMVEKFLCEFYCEHFSIPFLEKNIDDFRSKKIASPLLNETIDQLYRQRKNLTHEYEESRRVTLILDRNVPKEVFMGFYEIEYLNVLIVDRINYDYFKYLRNLRRVRILNDNADIKANMRLIGITNDKRLKQKYVSELKYLIDLVGMHNKGYNNFDDLEHIYFTDFIRNVKSNIFKNNKNVVFDIGSSYGI